MTLYAPRMWQALPTQTIKSSMRVFPLPVKQVLPALQKSVVQGEYGGVFLGAFDLGAPIHLMDASRDAQGLGHGQGYQYPHSFDGHFTPQQYLPTPLLGTTFYKPSDQGYEAQITARLEAWRKAQAEKLIPPTPAEKPDDHPAADTPRRE